MTSNKTITISNIEHLPEPVQRFLKFSGVIGTSMINRIEIEQVGRFKIGPDKPWASFTAVQTYDIKEAEFEWKVKMKMTPFVILTGSDKLQRGKARMKMLLYGVVPLVNAMGAEIDQGAMTRYLSETIWFPQAFLDNHITWTAIDSLSAKATLSIAEKSVEGIFHFDELGPVTSFTCHRYSSEGKAFVLRPWRCPIDEYKAFEGIQVAAKARAIWDFPEGEYTYINLEVTNIKYE